jgi:large subunit ribosomal protein L10
MLVGGRIEDKVFDLEGVKWVGGIDGGLEGLRAQLVYLLQSAGLGLTTALEGASKSLWLTMESRRSVMEEEQNGPKEGEKKEEGAKEESS